MKEIKTDDLRRMEGREGLVLQGCGGSLQEWVDGINDMFTEQGILLSGCQRRPSAALCTGMERMTL